MADKAPDTATGRRADVARRPSSDAAISDRVRGWRDRLLASPRFQRAAARFPPTRWIARRRARALFDLVAGFAYSQVLAACVRLDLFARLADGPCSADELAGGAGLATERMERLLAAAASLRLLERRSRDRWGLGPLGAPLVGNAAIAAMIEHHDALYRDLADPVALLRGDLPTSLGALWGYARETAPGALDDARVAAYSALMTASQPLVAGEILDAVPLARHRSLLDVGGGEGAFAEAAARRHPGLSVAVFDLPAVAVRATARFAAAGLAGRATAHGGSFLDDPLPTGADVATLVRVVHDHDDDHAMRLLRAVHAALAPGGALVLAEPMAGTPGAEPMGDAYFGLYLLAMGSGRPRMRETLTSMLRDAGFERVRPVATALPIQVRILVARKAATR